MNDTPFRDELFMQGAREAIRQLDDGELHRRRREETDPVRWRLLMLETLKRASGNIELRHDAGGEGVSEFGEIIGALVLMNQREADLAELFELVAEFAEPEDSLITRTPVEKLTRAVRILCHRVNAQTKHIADLNQQNTILYNTKKAAIDEGEKHRSRAQRVEKRLVNAHTFVKDLLEE